MSYNFSGTYADPVQNPTRQTGRPTYLPPHQRYNYIPNQTERQTDRGRGRGRGLGRGWSTTGGSYGGRGVSPRYQPNPNSNQYNNTVLENFNELKLEEENSNTGINFDAYEDIPVEITGSDVPDPVNTFAEIDLGSVLNDNIKNRCKYVKPTPIQRHAIPVALAGRDLMACAQTGSGKTAAFCFPIISGVLKTARSAVYGRREMVAYPLALVLSPTRELCCQIFEEANKFCYNTGVKVAVAYGGSPIYPQLRSMERGVDIIIVVGGSTCLCIHYAILCLIHVEAPVDLLLN